MNNIMLNGPDGVWRPAKCDTTGAMVVSGGVSGGGGSGTSDTTEVTQLAVKAAVQSIDTKTPTLIGGAVPVSGPVTDAQLRATPVNVSAATLPLPAGAATEATTAAIRTAVETLHPLTDTQLRASDLNVVPRNIVNKFREAFQSYTPGERWLESKTPGDLVFLDGNAAAASYLVISKDPLAAGTVTSLESVIEFAMPVEVSAGLHMSQRTLGQEFFAEFVDTDPAMVPPDDQPIASISQTTTTLTINFAQPHQYVPGQRIGVWGVVDSRLNYPSLVVAAAPTPLQITCTAGPGGTIPSVTAGPFASGYTYARSALGYASNGASMAFESATATYASFFIRSEAGDVLPSGVIAGNHSVTVSTTASVQAVNAPTAYTFQPTSEYKLTAFVDGVQWSDSLVDTLSGATNRSKRTQVVPNPTKQYKLRLRAANNKALTVPTAQIVSVSKSATTTATITFDRPHNLTTSDLIVAYGVRDVTNFAPLAVATAVASIVSPTSITVVWGTAVTATSYGGYVARVNGGNLMSALGAVAQSAQSAAVSTAADGGRVLTLIGSAAWTGALIGDLCNVIGLRDAVSGASLNLDGAYRVRNIATTTLDLERVDGVAMPADFGAVNCGGALIKRTDLRVSFVRVLDFERERVEIMPRPIGDQSTAVAVNVQNTVPAVSVVTTVGAVTASNTGIPSIIADVASAALTASANVAAITPTFGCSYEVNIPVTSVTGTTPTLDVVIQESDDSGNNWFDVYAFPRITSLGMYRSPKLPLTGNRVRYVQTVGGTSPSFTRSVGRLQSSDAAPVRRQIFDRAVSLTTLNSATSVLTTGGAENAQIVVNIGAATTPPALQLQGSDDGGVTWYAIGAPLTAVASSTVQQTVNNISADRIRAVVSTAGASVTAGYTLIKAF